MINSYGMLTRLELFYSYWLMNQESHSLYVNIFGSLFINLFIAQGPVKYK